MKIRKILIFGSTLLSEACAEYIHNFGPYEIVGQIPNINGPTVPGKILFPVALIHFRF